MPGKESNGHLTRYDIAPIVVAAAATLALIHFMGLGSNTKGWLIVSLLISQVIGVIAHEFGHAVAAWATGAHVNFMRLGARISEREPWVIPFGGFPILLYGFPLCGAVQSSLYRTDHYRARRCLMVAGGLVANTVLLVAGIVLIPAFPDTETHAVLLGWILANSNLIAVSVIPMKVRSYGRIQGNDALIFWDTLHYSDEEIRQYVDHAARNRGLDVDAMEAMSISALEAKHLGQPTNAPILMILIARLREDYHPRHIDYLLKLIELPIPQDIIGEFIDAGITLQLNQGPSDRPEIIDQLSRRLLALNNTVSTRGTRGSVLVDIGRIEDGKSMLEDVIDQTTSDFDRIYSAIFLAIAAKAQGKLPVARAYALTAEKLDPACPALKRVSDLLSA